jgi:hypothetical protein
MRYVIFALEDGAKPARFVGAWRWRWGCPLLLNSYWHAIYGLSMIFPTLLGLIFLFSL